MKNVFILSQETAFTLYVLVVGFLATVWFVDSFSLIDGDPVLTPAENLTIAMVVHLRAFGTGLFCYLLSKLFIPIDKPAISLYKTAFLASIYLLVLIVHFSRMIPYIHRSGLVEILVLPAFMAYLIGKPFYPSVEPKETPINRTLRDLIPFVVLFQLTCIYVTYIALGVFWPRFALPVPLDDSFFTE